MNDKDFLNKLAEMFEQAERKGNPLDIPEGSRTLKIEFSETLANELAPRLRLIAKRVE